MLQHFEAKEQANSVDLNQTAEAKCFYESFHQVFLRNVSKNHFSMLFLWDEMNETSEHLLY